MTSRPSSQSSRRTRCALRGGGEGSGGGLSSAHLPPPPAHRLRDIGFLCLTPRPPLLDQAANEPAAVAAAGPAGGKGGGKKGGKKGKGGKGGFDDDDDDDALDPLAAMKKGAPPTSNCVPYISVALPLLGVGRLRPCR